MPSPKAPEDGRTLVLCFDGTSNKYGDHVTNVIRLFQALEKKKPDRQICYYQPGIGTYVSPTKPFAALLSGVSMIIDKAVAWHLDDHVIGGYEFLMDNYSEGDRICLLGFSRGAYIARCVAGMLHMVGLLPKGNSEQVPFAYSLYKNDSAKGVELAHGFKHAFSRKVEVRFLGVWDSVTSVGLGGRTLPLTSHNGMVKIFRQALALDERRAKFRYNPWSTISELIPTPATPSPYHNSIEHRTTIEHIATKVQYPCRIDHPLDWPERPPPRILLNGNPLKYSYSRTGVPLNEPKSPSADCTQCEREGCKKRGETDSREVWFAGSHSDVGGHAKGLPRRDEDGTSASNPSLLWMVQQIQKADVGIVWTEFGFENAQSVQVYLKTVKSNQNDITQTPASEPRLGLRRLDTISELHEDVRLALVEDVKCPIRDKLGAPWSLWWLLECIPLRKHYLTEAGERWKRWSINLGRSRRIHLVDPSFHVSVQMRMEAGYTPKAKWKGEIRYVYE